MNTGSHPVSFLQLTGRGGSTLARLVLMVMWGLWCDSAVGAGTDCTHSVQAYLEESDRTAMKGMTGPYRWGSGKKILKVSRSAKVLWGLVSSSRGIWHGELKQAGRRREAWLLWTICWTPQAFRFLLLWLWLSSPPCWECRPSWHAQENSLLSPASFLLGGTTCAL